MANILQIENFGSGMVTQRSSLAADYVAPAAAFTPKDTTGFSTNNFVLAGRPGEESTELGQISGVSGNDINLVGNLRYGHSKFSELAVLVANQLKIYRAANVNGTVPADGAFSVLATINLAADSLTTFYNDASGGSGFWYKYTYFNSVTSSESSLADAVAARGGASTYYTSLYAVRREAGVLNNFFISDVDIFTYRSRAQSLVDSTISNRYTVPLSTPVSDVIENATSLIAAGYLLKADYGNMAQGSSKDGQSKIDEGMAILTNLVSGATELFDPTTGNSLMKTQVGGWPDDSTQSTGEFDNTGNRTGGGSSIFGISHKF